MAKYRKKPVVIEAYKYQAELGNKPAERRLPTCGNKSSDGFVCCRLANHEEHHADNDGNWWQPVLTQPSAGQPKSIRQYVYDWMDLPTHVKVARLKELNLFQAGDLQVRGDEIDRIWIKRAKEAGVEKKLLRIPAGSSERSVLPVPPIKLILESIVRLGAEFPANPQLQVARGRANDCLDMLARAFSPAVAPTNICDRCFTAFPADYRGMRVVFYDPELKCDIWRHAFDCTKPADNNCNSAAPAVAGRTQGDEHFKFEEWAISIGQGAKLARDEKFRLDGYEDRDIDNLWLGWKARAALRESARPNDHDPTTKDDWKQVAIEGNKTIETLTRPSKTQLKGLSKYLSRTYEFSTQEDQVKAMEMGAEIYEGVRRESAREAPSKDMFWPPANATEEHLYEIRNGKVKEYVMEHVQALQSETLEALRNMTEIAQGLLRGECYDRAGPKFLAHFHNAQRILGRSASPEAPAVRNKHKEVCDMLREMAKEKPDMKLDIAACVLLSILEPLTEEDIKRGREIAKELKLAAPAAPDYKSAFKRVVKHLAFEELTEDLPRKEQENPSQELMAKWNERTIKLEKYYLNETEKGGAH